MIDEAIRSRLKTTIFGKAVHYSPSTSSTNDDAIRSAKSGGAEGEIFLADAQTAGRGRMGRSWESPAGKNLYLSILLRPTLTPDRIPPITLVAGRAVHEILSSLLPTEFGDQLKIKQPNDVCLGTKKIAGILAESEIKGTRVEWVVCGIGINLNADPSDFSREVGQTATSFKMATARIVDRTEVATRLIESFEKHYARFCQEGPVETVAYCNRYPYEAAS